jgi:hypothetical protein
MSNPLPIPARGILIAGLALAALGLAAALAPTGVLDQRARADERMSAVTDPTTKKECGACHMAFQPGFLPKRSWEAVMSGLKDHFGENAELDAATTQTITKYLVANAADARDPAPRILRGVDAKATPLRITETPWWQRAHEKEVRPEAFLNPKVGSKANCVACHAGADKGVYEDD